jgi:hypothetical protein
MQASILMSNLAEIRAAGSFAMLERLKPELQLRAKTTTSMIHKELEQSLQALCIART